MDKGTFYNTRGISSGSSGTALWNSLISATVDSAQSNDIVLTFGKPGSQLTKNDFKISDTSLGNSFNNQASGFPFSSPNAIISQYYNGNTYIAYAGIGDDPYIIKYNHSTGLYSAPVKVATIPVAPGDSHTMPALLVDNDGYIHLFYGCHISNMKYVKSTNPEDITTWTVMGDPATRATYPQVFQFSNDTIYLFYRYDVSGPWQYKSSTNGGTSWSAATSLFNFFIYGKFIKGTGDTIHGAYSYTTHVDVFDRWDVYYVYFDGTDWKKADGTILTLPITRAGSDKIYDSGLVNVVEPDINYFGSNPYIVYSIMDATKPNNFVHKFVKWSGAAWETTTIADITLDYHEWIQNSYNRRTIEVISDSVMNVYVMTTGGLCRYTTTDGGATWSNVETILNDSKIYLDSAIVKNGQDGVRMVFGAYTQYYNDVLVDGYDNKIYLWGSSGFIKNYREISSLSKDVTNKIITLSLASPISNPNIAQVQLQNLTPHAITNNNPVIDADGNEYTEVVIGTQIWLLENLRTTKYNDASSIPAGLNNANWALEDGSAGHDGAIAYPNNDIANVAQYGVHYNWYAVNNAKGIAPSGYHVASQADLDTLITYLSSLIGMGSKIKEAGLAHWNSPNGGLNSYGFTGRGSGYRADNGSFLSFKDMAIWWLSDAVDTGNAKRWYAINTSADCGNSGAGKKYGWSVRCVKD